jgi:hypothetical protein
MKLPDCFQRKKKNVNFPSEMFGIKTSAKKQQSANQKGLPLL